MVMRPHYSHIKDGDVRTALEHIYNDMLLLVTQQKYFPPFVTTDKPDATSDQYRYTGIFFTDTGMPAWSNGTIWVYADGSAA